MDTVNVIGGTLVDLSFGLPKQFFHRYQQAAKIELPFGEKLMTEGYVIGPGGSGVNVAAGLVRAGVRVWFHTGLATDTFGDYLRKTLKKLQLELDAGDGGEQTPLSVILRIGGERTIITGRSVPSSFPDTIPETGWIHVGPLHGTSEASLSRLIAHQVKTGQEVSLNPSIDMIEGRSRTFLSILKVAKILIVNRLEAVTLARLPHRTPIAEVLPALLALGPEVICLTDGEHGAHVYADGVTHFAEALKTKVDRVDATGAGDAFTSGFLIAYLSERDELGNDQLLELALGCAIANSASSVTEVGGHAGLLDYAEMRNDARRVKIKAGD